MKELALIGKLVMTRLRDEAISFADGLLSQHWKAPALQKLQRDLKALTPAQSALVRRTVRASVDAGVHAFLFALQEAMDAGVVELRVKGKNVAQLTDGLHGELFTSKGWQARFSDFGEGPKNG